MNVLEVIDSLNIGGAEKMLLSIAQALIDNGVNVAIALGREKGNGFDLIPKDVPVLELNRNNVSLRQAILKFRNFIKTRQIDVIHVHGSSVFFVILATVGIKIPIFWHIHQGRLVDSSWLKQKLYLLAASRVTGIIAVSSALYNWLVQSVYINHDNIIYLPNFPRDIVNYDNNTTLPGISGKRLVSVANLRPEKDQLNLINAFYKAKNLNEWHLLCIGNKRDIKYVKAIEDLLEKLDLKDRVHLMGLQKDVLSMVKKCNIAVISSCTEALPVALLEYGMLEIPVISTDVGECSSVLHRGKFGVIVDKQNVDKLALALDCLVNDTTAKERAKAFKQEILLNYSQNAFIKKLLFFFEALK